MKAQNRTLVQSSAQQRSSRRQQRGNGLLYAMLGSALLALGSYYAYGIYSDKAAATAVQSDIVNAQDTVQSTQRIFGINGSYAGLTLTNLRDGNAVPARMRVASAVQNGFNQSVTTSVSSSSGSLNDLLTFGWPVSKASCLEFAVAASGFSRKVLINTTSVKALDGTFAPTTAATECAGSAATFPIVYFTIGISAGS